MQLNKKLIQHGVGDVTCIKEYSYSGILLHNTGLCIKNKTNEKNHFIIGRKNC